MPPIGPDLGAGARGTRFESGRSRYIVLSVPIPRQTATLSPAEQQVRDALLRGRSYREIAGARGTSVRTVAKQVASVFRKLGVRSRAELAAVHLAGAGKR